MKYVKLGCMASMPDAESVNVALNIEPNVEITSSPLAVSEINAPNPW